LTEPLQRFERGSVFVGHSGDQVVKLFPPGEEQHALVEASCLAALAGALPVATPILHESLVVEGHTCLRMQRLPGVELLELWPTLDPAARMDLGRQLGELMSVLHAIPPPIALDRPDWEQWVTQRSASAVADQLDRGAPPSLASSIPALLERADLDARHLGFTHTELMRDHLLVERSPSGWRLSGLFDFEPAMVAPLDYELAAVGVFFSGGEGAVWRSVLQGMGRDPEEPGLSERVMGLYLVHRYANLRFAMDRTSANSSLSIESLANIWFSSDP